MSLQDIANHPEVEYGNDYNAGYIYIDKMPGGTGNSFPLTSFIIKEWSRAIVHISVYFVNMGTN